MIQKQEHEMCKTNVKTYFYYVNICKHEHGKKKQDYGVRLCLRLMLNRIKIIGNYISIYTPWTPS